MFDDGFVSVSAVELIFSPQKIKKQPTKQNKRSQIKSHMSADEAIPIEAVAVVLSDSEAGFKTMTNLFTDEFNEAGARLFMSNNKWPTGIQDLFIRNLQLVPIRFFVCDDSGSMSANDSRKIVSANGNK